VPGVVIIVIVMVLVLPVAIMLAGAVWSGVIGWAFGEGDDAAPEAPPPTES